MQCHTCPYLLLVGFLWACDRSSIGPLEAVPNGNQHEKERIPGAQPHPPVLEPVQTSPKRATQIAEALSALPNVSDEEVNWGKNEAVYGGYGVVTSVDVSATRAGIKILEAGGNAVDAAVATALALAVTHPSAGNLGGGGFLLLKIGSTVEAIDFRENSPAALTDALFWKMIQAGGRGPASVGVPGTVAGLHLAHSRHGKLPWAEVVRPAEVLAREGYRLGERQAKTIAWASGDLLRDASAKVQLFSQGKPKSAGTVVKRADLALALQRIADSGPAGFYEGPTAQDLISSLGPEGIMTLADLKDYRAQLRDPLYFDFGEYRVITTPAPSAGGVALAQNLLILRKLGVDQTKENLGPRLHLIAEASRRAQLERRLFVESPDGKSEEELQLIRSRTLDPSTWLQEHPVDRGKATPSESLHKGFKKLDNEQKHTTHLSVIDKNGGLVSCTVTLSASFGARILSRETGIVFNNSVASFSSIGVNTPQAGKRTTSSMAPTLVLRGEDQALVLGSPGGDTIPSTITQTFLHLVLDGDSLTSAVEKPRFHQGFVPDELSIESGRPLSTNAQKELRKLGHHVVTTHTVIGDANIAARIGNTSFAVSDRREGGSALAAHNPDPP